MLRNALNFIRTVPRKQLACLVFLTVCLFVFKNVRHYWARESELSDFFYRAQDTVNSTSQAHGSLPKYNGPYHRYKRRHHDGSWVRLEGPSQAVREAHHTGIIPHIIHQTWDTAELPQYFVPWVLSWVGQNPDWEYWFWTQPDVVHMLRTDYPEHESLYGRYTALLSKADAMRYFVLYSYGGLYADLDTECLRPMATLTDGQTCLLTEETHEHAHLLYQRHPANLMTTIMACRPRHQLFLAAISNLSRYQRRYPDDVLRSTGPFYLDTLYRQMEAAWGQHNVKVLDPEYLLPTYDVEQSSEFDLVCNRVSHEDPDFMQDTCEKWETKRRYHNKPSNTSYATHFWVHVGMSEASWKRMRSQPIEDVINVHSRAASKDQRAQEHGRENSEHQTPNKESDTLKYRHNKHSGFLPNL